MIIRATLPAAFDANVTRDINEAFREVPLMLGHVRVETPEPKDMIKVGAFSGFGSMPQKAEGADFTIDQPIQRFTQAFVHLTYELGFEVSKEMVDDGRERDVAMWASALGVSARDAVNILAANVLNNGYSTTWGDGKVLFATDHPTSGTAFGNTPSSAADLSATTLAAAIVALMNQVDHRGLRIPVTGVELFVPPALDQMAFELTSSNSVPHSTDNEPNYLRGRCVYNGPNPYLTDTNQWQVIATGQRHGLVFFLREPFNAGSYMKESNHGLVHWGRFRASAGVEEWRGTYGSSGA